MSETLLIAAGAFAAGFVQGLSGFGFGITAMAFWAWAVEPQLAGPMVVFGSLLGQLLAVRTAFVGFSFRRVLPFVIGGIVGVPIGTGVLRYIDPAAFRACVGAILVIYCPAMLLVGRLPQVPPRLALAGDVLVGIIGGMMGGLGGLPGPPVILWCTWRGWDKHAQRAVMQSYATLMHVLTLAAYVGDGLIGRAALGNFAVVGAAMLLPTLAGTALYWKFDDLRFRRVVLVLLTMSGIALLGTAVFSAGTGR